MFNFIRKTFPKFRSKTESNYALFNSFSSSLPSPKSLTNPSNHNSFAASYLVSNCGFSSQNAVSASKRLSFKTSHRADSVITFFKNLGVTESDISKIVKSFPQILHYNPDDNFLPKIEFFRSVGLSGDSLVKFFIRGVNVMCYSLDNQIVPYFALVKNLLQSDKHAVTAIVRFPRVLTTTVQAQFKHNAHILRHLGVPQSNVASLLKLNPRNFAISSDKFRKIAEEVQEMGFDPSKFMFVSAFDALKSMSKSTWDKKVKIYKEWGWSDDQVLSAFGKHPRCMTLSKDKLGLNMDFFVNKMGWEPSFIAARPLFLCFSLEKRIFPRCMLYKDLLEKGLIEKKSDFRFQTWLSCSDILFLDMVNKRFNNEAPELLRLYLERLDLSKRLDKLT